MQQGCSTYGDRLVAILWELSQALLCTFLSEMLIDKEDTRAECNLLVENPHFIQKWDFLSIWDDLDHNWGFCFLPITFFIYSIANFFSQKIKDKYQHNLHYCSQDNLTYIVYKNTFKSLALFTMSITYQCQN